MRTKNKFLLPIFILAVSIQSLNLFGQANKLWLTAGQNQNNTRNAANETKITPQNAGSLKVKWAFTTGGDVSATPIADQDAVYFPESNLVSGKFDAMSNNHKQELDLDNIAAGNYFIRVESGVKIATIKVLKLE